MAFILNLFGSLISFTILSTASLFSYTYTKESFLVNNIVIEGNKYAFVEVLEYKTIYNYSYKVPTGTKNVLVEGKNGYAYVNEEGEKIYVDATDEIIEVGTGNAGIYSGKLTGYGPDCVGCSSTGTVACRTKDGKAYSLINDGIYYDDAEYGKIRILAADHKAFPCGTIIEIKNKDFTGELGIVLDTGSAMRDAYQEGYILIDLAFEKGSLAYTATNSNTTFTVKRWGW